MKLGLAIGYSGAHLEVPVALVRRAEETRLRLGLVGPKPMAPTRSRRSRSFAARTSRIKLGTGIMQLAARTPANAAMSAASIDAMAGGGRSSQAWVSSDRRSSRAGTASPWGRPYYRVKDYVAIMRKIFKREGPVTHEGREISLPTRARAPLASPSR